MCGGDLEIKQGSAIAVCTYCGTQQTVLTADNERKTKLYNRAHELRLNNDFDQALGVFETIIAEFPDEAEAYWGLCLCKYGIEYVDDPITKLKVPTCHRTCYDSIMNDDDYRKAVDLAGITARNLYFNEAIQIDAIQRSILTIARNERPYDIFICYKESDGRQRTKDSVLAQDIYDALVDQGGYKVFFSRITLEDKLGEEFEPYIFSALNTAKVMLVVGTSNSNMNSVWVKNEWSRYLKLMKGDKGKLLIPCYSDMDAYDLPEEFKNLQAQDMNKIGFMQDLLRGVKKVVSQTGTVVEKTLVSADIPKLIKRVENFIEENNWASANEYCERVLDADPDNVQAYLFKLLIDKRVTEVKALKNCSDSFEGNVNYQRLTKIADEKLKLQLKEYLEYIREKKNRERVAREKAERQRLEQLEAERKKRNKILFVALLSTTGLVVFLLLMYAVVTVVIPDSKYNDAVTLLEQEDFDGAITVFEENIDYRDSKELLSKAKYLKAVALYENEEFAQARTIFEELNNYQDCQEYLSKYNLYDKGNELIQQGRYKDGFTYLTQVGILYKNCAEINKVAYSLACEYAQRGFVNDSLYCLDYVNPGYEDRDKLYETCKKYAADVGTWENENHRFNIRVVIDKDTYDEAYKIEDCLDHYSLLSMGRAILEDRLYNLHVTGYHTNDEGDISFNLDTGEYICDFPGYEENSVLSKTSDKFVNIEDDQKRTSTSEMGHFSAEDYNRGLEISINNNTSTGGSLQENLVNVKSGSSLVTHYKLTDPRIEGTKFRVVFEMQGMARQSFEFSDEIVGTFKKSSQTIIASESGVIHVTVYLADTGLTIKSFEINVN